MNDTASILIVDDEEVVRHSHLRSLADTGCHTEAAEDGQKHSVSWSSTPSMSYCWISACRDWTEWMS